MSLSGHAYDDYSDGYGDHGHDHSHGHDHDHHDAPKLTDIVKKLTSAAEVETFISEWPEHPVIIGYFDSEDSDDHKVFKDVAHASGMQYKYAAVTDKAVLKELKYSGTTLFVHKPSKDLDTKIDKPKSRYPSKNLSMKVLTKFIYDKAVPTLGEVTTKTESYYDKSSVPLITAFGDFTHGKTESSYTYILNRLKKVVPKYNGKFIFAIANKKEYSSLVSYYSFPKESIKKSGEVLIGLKVHSNYYTMTKPFTAENVESFLEEYKKGNLIGKEKVSRNHK